MSEVKPSSEEPKEKHRRGYSSLDAIDPNDGGKWQVLLQDSKIDLNDAFTQQLSARAHLESWSNAPKVFVNYDGDCIELLLSNDNYRAERIDSLVTVYVNRENGELVGALVKGVRSFIRKMVERIPGFKIEILDGKVKLEYLFTAGLWSHDEPANVTLVHTYQKLRKIAEDANLEIELQQPV